MDGSWSPHWYVVSFPTQVSRGREMMAGRAIRLIYTYYMRIRGKGKYKKAFWVVPK